MLSKLSLFVIGAMFVVGGVSHKALASENEIDAANPSADSSHVYTAQELDRLKDSIDPSVMGQERETPSLSARVLGYYCEARSYTTGRWYWWYSYNLAYSRYQALNACVRYNGYTCTLVGCSIR